jgi:hypothetical protein
VRVSSSRVTIHVAHGEAAPAAAVVAERAGEPVKIGHLLRRKSLSSADSAAAAAGQSRIEASTETSLEFLVVYGCGGSWCVASFFPTETWFVRRV